MGTLRDFTSRAADSLEGMTDGVKRAYKAFREQPAVQSAPEQAPVIEGEAARVSEPAPRAQPARAYAPANTGTNVVPYNPVVGQAPGVPGGPTNTPKPQFTPAPGALSPEAAAAARQPQYINTGTTGAATPPGYGEVPPNTPPNGPKAPRAGLRVGGGYGTAAGGLVAAGMEAFDPNVRSAVDPSSDMSTTDRLRQAGRSALRVGGGILGAAGGAAIGGPAAIITGAAGGAGGYAAGNWVADKVFGEQSQPVRQQAPVVAGVQTQAPAQADTTPIATNQGAKTPQELMAGTAVPNPGSGAFQRTGGQARGLRANTFDGLGAMPANATPEEAAQYLQKTNVINQGRAAEQQAQTGQAQGGDELAPLRRLAAMDRGAKPGHAGSGSLAALGAYGALDRMKSNAANLNLRQQQIQSTNALAMATKQHDWANQDREFANKVGQQNQKSIEEENTEHAARGVDRKQFESTLGKFDNAGYDAAKKQASADRQVVFKRSFAAAGVDPTQATTQQRAQMHQFLNIRQQVMANRDDGLADYFKNSQVDSDVAQSYAPAKVERATRPGESWIVVTQNGNRIPLKALQGGQFQWTGSNKPINGDFAALTQKLINNFKG